VQSVGVRNSGRRPQRGGGGCGITCTRPRVPLTLALSRTHSLTLTYSLSHTLAHSHSLTLAHSHSPGARRGGGGCGTTCRRARLRSRCPLLEKGIQTPMAQGRSTEIISMIKWTRTSSLSITISLSPPSPCFGCEVQRPLSSELSTYKTVKSRPYAGLGFQIKVLHTFQVVPSSLKTTRRTATSRTRCPLLVWSLGVKGWE